MFQSTVLLNNLDCLHCTMSSSGSIVDYCLSAVQICPKPEVALKIKQGDSGNATRSQRTLLGPTKKVATEPEKMEL